MGKGLARQSLTCLDARNKLTAIQPFAKKAAVEGIASTAGIDNLDTFSIDNLRTVATSRSEDAPFLCCLDV